MNIKHTTIALFTIFIAISIRLLMSYYSLMNLPPSSDEAIAIIKADQIHNGIKYPLLFIGQPYQFPIEAYLMSPFVELMPHNSLGARYQVLLLGALSTLIFLIAAYRLSEKNKRWPGLLLILIPSAYWLTWQSGYSAPQYSVSALFAALMFLLAAVINQKKNSALLLTALLGIVAGLSLSNHLLLLSVVVSTALVAIFNGHFILSLKRLASLTIGLLIGLIPLFLALHTLPNAYEKLTSQLPFNLALVKLIGSVSQYALPGVLGANPPFFGDFPVHLEWGETVRTAMVCLFAGVVGIVIFKRLTQFLTTTYQNRWIKLGWPDMFVGTTLLCMFLMASNSRGSWSDHRYLLPVAWAFPFLVSYLYSILSLRLAKFASVVIVFLATFNFATSFALIKEWRAPHKIQHHADIPHLGALQDWMAAEKIDACYATFWLSYRVTYESYNNILCAPVYNERFSDWPVPFKDSVDKKPNVAFVLSDTYGAKFKASKFQAIVSQNGITYERKKIGQLFVYYNFKKFNTEEKLPISPDTYITSSNIKHNNIKTLSDKNLKIPWEMLEPQQKDQFIEFDFNQMTNVSDVILLYPMTILNPPRSLRVTKKLNSKWTDVITEVPFRLDRVRYANNHPIFGQMQQTISLGITNVDAIRIHIHTPELGSQWDLTEISLYTH